MSELSAISSLSVYNLSIT